jgi:hypothetical protein
MRKKKHWEDQLNQVMVIEIRDNIFGRNIDWNVEDVKKYIHKLEKLGARDINIKDGDTIEFELTDERDDKDLLLFILTGGGAGGRLPVNTKYNRKRATLTLHFDY